MCLNNKSDTDREVARMALRPSLMVHFNHSSGLQSEQPSHSFFGENVKQLLYITAISSSSRQANIFCVLSRGKR